MKKDYPSQQPPYPIKPRFVWRVQYDEIRDQTEGDLAKTINDEPSLTQQHFTEDADLNVIAKRFGLNEIPLTPGDPSHYRDTTQDPDLAQILQYQIDARNAFMTLPAKLQKRFHHSPQELWNFLQDPDNAEEALRLGLLTRSADATDHAAAPHHNTASANAPTDATGPSKPEPSGGVQKNPPETPQQTSQKGT